MAEVEKIYHVLIESKATLTQEAEVKTVAYASPTYQDAWVGARTVCRMGTNHGQDTKMPRHFFQLDEDGAITDEPFECGPAQYTVRRIFVQNTRKQGKRRMTSVDGATFMQVVADKKIKMSAPLQALLTEILNESGGAKITVATARRLGIKTAETEAGGGDSEVA